MQKNFFIFILMFIAVSCNNANSKGKTGVDEQSLTVVTQKVTISSIDTSIRYSGSAMPWDKLILSFKSSGRIKKLLFEEGDLIKKNQYLGSIKETDYWLQKNLASIQVKTLEPDYKRVLSLSEQNAIPGAEKGRMEGRYKAAKTQLRQAESMLYGTILKSSMAGIVVKKLVTVGDLVSPARPVGVVLDLSKMKIIVVVPENELKFFKRDMDVLVTFDSLSKTIKGKIHRISYVADEKTRGFGITVIVPNIMKDGMPQIRAGMLAVITIPRPHKKGIFLPFDAIMTGVDGMNYVYASVNKRAKRYNVKIGEIIQSKVTILSGLIENMDIIVSGQRFCRQGMLLWSSKTSEPTNNSQVKTK
jgi:RND family efflux transporter MFP subunit